MKVRVVLDEVDAARAFVQHMMIRVEEKFETWEDPRDTYEIVLGMSDEDLLKWTREFIGNAKMKERFERV